MFEVYLTEMARARAVERRQRRFVVVSAALTLAACVHAYIGHRLSVEALPGGRLHSIFVASFGQPLPPPPPTPMLRWPDEETTCDGGLRADDEGQPSSRPVEPREISFDNSPD